MLLIVGSSSAQTEDLLGGAKVLAIVVASIFLAIAASLLCGRAHEYEYERSEENSDSDFDPTEALDRSAAREIGRRHPKRR